jgi:hypothetical protein
MKIFNNIAKVDNNYNNLNCIIMINIKQLNVQKYQYKLNINVILLSQAFIKKK